MTNPNDARIHAYNNNSASARVLSEVLGIRRIATVSSFRGQEGQVIINWGSGRCRCDAGQATVINPFAAVNRAGNKHLSFRSFEEADVPIPAFTTDVTTANNWVAEGSTVYARETLRGHSGEGITVVTEGEVPAAPLYTKGITGRRREYRIHVFQGEVILVQKKKRRSGFADNPDANNDVRNLNGGWVFAISDADPSEPVRVASIAAINALGLDFGAVDVIEGAEGQGVFILEVNTACGLVGETTITAYENTFRRYLGMDIEEFVSELVEGQDAPTPTPTPTPASTPASTTLAEVTTGARVRILDGADITNYTYGFSQSMRELIGQEYTVESSESAIGGRVGVRLVGNPNTWDIRGLEVVTEETTTIQTGQWYRVLRDSNPSRVGAEYSAGSVMGGRVRPRGVETHSSLLTDIEIIEDGQVFQAGARVVITTSEAQRQSYVYGWNSDMTPISEQVQVVRRSEGSLIRLEGNTFSWDARQMVLANPVSTHNPNNIEVGQTVTVQNGAVLDRPYNGWRAGQTYFVGRTLRVGSIGTAADGRQFARLMTLPYGDSTYPIAHCWDLRCLAPSEEPAVSPVESSELSEDPDVAPIAGWGRLVSEGTMPVFGESPTANLHMHDTISVADPFTDGSPMAEAEDTSFRPTGVDIGAATETLYQLRGQTPREEAASGAWLSGSQQSTIRRIRTALLQLEETSRETVTSRDIRNRLYNSTMRTIRGLL